MYRKMLIKVDAGLNIRDPAELFAFFAGRIAARDGALDMDEAEEATYAMAIADRLVNVFSATPHYQCVGTREHDGHIIVLVGSDAHWKTYKWLFDSVNQRYLTDWKVVASQPYDEQPVEEITTDEQGDPITVTVVRLVPDIAVPQSIRPWLTRDLDTEGNEIPDDPILTPSRLGSIQGTAEWVIEEPV